MPRRREARGRTEPDGRKGGNENACRFWPSRESPHPSSCAAEWVSPKPSDGRRRQVRGPCGAPHHSQPARGPAAREDARGPRCEGPRASRARARHLCGDVVGGRLGLEGHTHTRTSTVVQPPSIMVTAAARGSSAGRSHFALLPSEANRVSPGSSGLRRSVAVAASHMSKRAGSAGDHVASARRESLGESPTGVTAAAAASGDVSTPPGDSTAAGPREAAAAAAARREASRAARSARSCSSRGGILMRGEGARNFARWALAISPPTPGNGGFAASPAPAIHMATSRYLNDRKASARRRARGAGRRR